MSKPSKLPVVTVQPTFLQVIKEVRDGIAPSDVFWISCYNSSEPSVHSKVRVTLDEVNRDSIHLEPSAGVEVNDFGRDGYVVAAPKSGIPGTRILTPTFEYADSTRADPQHPHRITAFDVAPDCSQFATGFLDGSVHIYSTAQKSPPAETAFGKPHKSTTTSLRFFPSSRVLLSAGADFTLCILPADPAPTSSALAPVRSLMGHRRAITSTAIVSKGRNILSASLDGTVRLWDVPSGEKIHVFSAGAGHFVPVTSTSLGARAAAAVSTPSSQVTDPDPREVETSGNLLFCALQTKSFEAIDLGARASVYLSPPGAAPLTSIAYASAHNLLATGSSTGVVELFDTRALGTPVLAFSRMEAGIADLAFGEDGKTLVVSTDDGLPFVAGFTPATATPPESTVGVAAELIGADCDPVRSVRVAGRDVWSAADDGVVRKYTNVY